MRKKIRVATSDLTNTIFAGKPLKAGIWGKQKDDVTMDCLTAVVEHVKNFGKPVIISNSEGKPLYKIIVKKLEK